MDDATLVQNPAVQTTAPSDEEIDAEIDAIKKVVSALEEEKAGIDAALAEKDQADDAAVNELLATIDEATREAQAVEGEVMQELEQEAENAARDALNQA